MQDYLCRGIEEDKDKTVKEAEGDEDVQRAAEAGKDAEVLFNNQLE